MSYRPESDIGDWISRRRTIGIPGVDPHFIGVETVPAPLGAATFRGVTMQDALTVASVNTLTTTNNSATLGGAANSPQIGMIVTGTNIPLAGSTTTSDAVESNTITVSSGTSFQTGMIFFPSSSTSTTTIGAKAFTGFQTLFAYITNVNGNTLTFDRPINIPSGVRVQAAPVVVGKNSSNVYISNNATGSGSTAITFYWALHSNAIAAQIYVPKTIKVQHARVSLQSTAAAVGAHNQPLPADIQDARILIWGPFMKTNQYFNDGPLYAMSRNLVSTASNTTGSFDNTSFFTAAQSSIAPITGTANVSSSSTSVTGANYTTGSERITSASGTNWTGTNITTSGFTHTTGSTAPLTINLSDYMNLASLTYTVSGRTAGSFNINFGGQPYNSITASGSQSPSPIIEQVKSFTITPTSDFDGTIVLSVKDTPFLIPVPTNNYITSTQTVLETTSSTTTQSNSGSTTLYLASVNGLATGMKVFGPNVPVGATITAIQGTTTPYSVTLSTALTGNITAASPAFITINEDNIPLGISTIVSGSGTSTITVADASSFRTGMVLAATGNVVASTITINTVNTTTNQLGLSAAVTLAAGTGVYGYTRVSASSGISNGTMTLTVAASTTGSIQWSAWPHIGYASSSSSTPIYLNVPSGAIKTNQSFSGPGVPTGTTITSADRINNNLWRIVLTANLTAGLPGIPLYHHTFSTTAGSIGNSITPSANLVSASGYLVSGRVVNAGYLPSDTRFTGTANLTKPALLTSSTNLPSIITPTYTIRPNRLLDTKLQAAGFFSTRYGTATTDYANNDTIINASTYGSDVIGMTSMTMRPSSSTAAFQTPVTLQGGCHYFVGFWSAASFWGSISIPVSSASADIANRFPQAAAARQYNSKYYSGGMGSWTPSATPPSNTQFNDWYAGFTVNGSTPTNPIQHQNVYSSILSTGTHTGIMSGFALETIPYIALYE